MYSPPTKDAGPWALGLLRWCAVQLLVAVFVALQALPAKAAVQRAIILEINDAIGPAIADYIVRELRTVDTRQTGETRISRKAVLPLERVLKVAATRKTG